MNRTKSVMLRFTEAELVSLQEAHKASGYTWVPFATWVRQLALRAVTAPAAAPSRVSKSKPKLARTKGRRR